MGKHNLEVKGSCVLPSVFEALLHSLVEKVCDIYLEISAAHCISLGCLLSEFTLSFTHRRDSQKL